MPYYNIGRGWKGPGIFIRPDFSIFSPNHRGSCALVWCGKGEAAGSGESCPFREIKNFSKFSGFSVFFSGELGYNNNNEINQ